MCMREPSVCNAKQCGHIKHIIVFREHSGQEKNKWLLY